jgi:leader peptidase (prepilin peptidase)/N-methyltransferase
MERIIVFIFGSIVGSFLNVCIHRMPLEQSVVVPRSFCPHCKKTIPWHDNIPLLSYIILRAKCRFCGKRISLRYFIVELLTALVFLLLFNVYGISFNFFFYVVLSTGLIVATFVDIQYRIIPDEISVGGIIVGFILSALKGFSLRPVAWDLRPVFNSFLGIIAGGGILYLTGFIFDLVYFKMLKKPPIQGETESMGGGDIKLLAMIGAFLGWKKAILIFFLAPFFGAVVGIINLFVKKDHTIPYGPFLSLAAFVSIFWADKIIGLILLVR